MTICKVCGNKFNSIKALSSHIRQAHNISSENYYLQYIDNHHTCKVCGKETKFINLTYGFHNYCSYKCANQDLDKIEKQNQTFRSNPNNVEQARQHIINHNKSEKARITSSKIGLRTGPLNMKKAHEQDTIKWCDVCQQNTKHLIGIGCMTCYNKSESHKKSIINTVKKRYGEQYSNVYQVPSVKDKIKSTSMQRYGVENPGASKIARIKAINTMRQNGNYSKDEDYFAAELNKLGIRFKPQYKSDKYPFDCDFYLIDYDIYIELNIYWSHNNHFFDSNNQDDLDTLAIWTDKANKGHKQYQNAINVWTKKDILKRDTAQQNNLNYVVLWSRQEIDFYLNYLNELIKEKSV